MLWDRVLLDQFHWRQAIESAGPLIPGFLEFCYLLVYGVGPLVVAMAVLARRKHGQRVGTDQLWMAYLAGTLGAYALFPYFPFRPSANAVPGQRPAARHDRDAPGESVLPGRLRHPFERIPERARLLGVFGRVGIAADHSGEALDRMEHGWLTRSWSRSRRCTGAITTPPTCWRGLR